MIITIEPTLFCLQIYSKICTVVFLRWEKILDVRFCLKLFVKDFSFNEIESSKL